MHFVLVDAVLERTADRIVTIKAVSNAEEYLRDHFAGFPVLPGVFMLEAMVQAGRLLVQDRAGVGVVLGQVRALRYGRFVQPGSSLRVEVTLIKESAGMWDCKGEATAVAPTGEAIGVAASGRFSLRPVRLSIEAPAGAGSATIGGT